MYTATGKTTMKDKVILKTAHIITVIVLDMPA